LIFGAADTDADRLKLTIEVIEVLEETAALFCQGEAIVLSNAYRAADLSVITATGGGAKV